MGYNDMSQYHIPITPGGTQSFTSSNMAINSAPQLIPNAIPGMDQLGADAFHGGVINNLPLRQAPMNLNFGHNVTDFVQHSPTYGHPNVINNFQSSGRSHFQINSTIVPQQSDVNGIQQSDVDDAQQDNVDNFLNFENDFPGSNGNGTEGSG